jgi:hypothetical protein
MTRSTSPSRQHLVQSAVDNIEEAAVPTCRCVSLSPTSTGHRHPRVSLLDNGNMSLASSTLANPSA